MNSLSTISKSQFHFWTKVPKAMVSKETPKMKAWINHRFHKSNLKNLFKKVKYKRKKLRLPNSNLNLINSINRWINSRRDQVFGDLFLGIVLQTIRIRAKLKGRIIWWRVNMSNKTIWCSKIEWTLIIGKFLSKLINLAFRSNIQRENEFEILHRFGAE